MLSASCATRKRQSAASGPTASGSGSIATEKRDPALAPAPLAFRPERLGQAELLQDRRVELVGEGVDVLAEAHEALADRPQRLRLRAAGRGELGAPGVDGEDGEPLGEVVVQLAGEERAFLLLRADQPAAQILERGLGPLLLRDVPQDAERAERAAAAVALGGAGEVMDPDLPASGMQVAILDGEPLDPSVVHPLANVHHALAVVGMNVLQPELAGPEPFVLLRRNAAEVAHAGRPCTCSPPAKSTS